MTCVGPIAIRRRYWQCRCGAAGAYAADDVLGLTGRLSRRLQEHACRLTADTSFAKAGEHLRALLDVPVSAETLRTLSERHGQQMARWQPTDTAGAAAFRAAAGEVEFTVDAGKVNTREGGWRDLKIAVFQKRTAGAPAPPSAWREQRLPEATSRVAFADIGPATVFRKGWRGWSRRLGVGQSGAMHVLADGAEWIWKSVDRVFSGCRQTLDLFHACAHLSRAADGLHGEGTPAATLAFEQARALLLDSGWHGVCRWVGECLAAGDTPARRAVLDRVIGYFSKHVGRLGYAADLAAGRAIGSGAVEGQAKTLGLRLKTRGARWRTANARRMAALVSVRNSIQWTTYWQTAA